MPKKSRSGRKLVWYHESLLTFFRKWDSLKIFLSDNSIDSQELTFDQAIEILECNSNEPKQKIDISLYYELLHKNKWKFDTSLNEEEVSENTIKRWRSNKTEVIKYLRIIKWKWWLIDIEDIFFNNLLESIIDWKLPLWTMKNMKSELKNLMPFDNVTKVYNTLLDLVPKEFISDDNTEKIKNSKTEVILNEYII